MTLPKAIMLPVLPYDLDAKIFLVPCFCEEWERACDCVPEYESMNDKIRFFINISGVNPELMGPAE